MWLWVSLPDPSLLPPLHFSAWVGNRNIQVMSVLARWLLLKSEQWLSADSIRKMLLEGFTDVC